MNFKKTSLLCLLTCLLALTASAASTQQKFFAGCYDSPDGSFAKYPESVNELRRGAYPYKNRAISLDLFHVVTADRIIVTLQKFDQKSTDTASEAAQMQVYTGVTKEQMSLAADAKVQIQQEDKNGVLTETITVTNLPKARYLFLYAPRTARFYVFGIQDGRKDIQIWADAIPALDPAIAAIPELKTLDPHWARTALPLASCGFLDLQEESLITTRPYAGQGANSQLGWPWKKRAIEFALNASQPVERIVFDLRKMQTQFSEMTTGLENATIYQSEDGTSFQPVPPTKVTHQLYRINNEIYARVTIAGNFQGKFFRIYAPWTKNYYVFGMRRTSAALKVFAPASLTVSEFNIPVCLQENRLPFQFWLDGTEDATGTISLWTTERTPEKLWSVPFSPAYLNKINHFDIALSHSLPDGIHTLKLIVEQNGKKIPSSAEANTWILGNRLLLTPQATSDAWIQKPFVCSTQQKTFWISTASKAKLQYQVPQAGDYAIYALLKGKGKFHCSFAPQASPKQLVTWHPIDLTENTVGMNYMGAHTFQKQESFVLEAVESGCAISDVILIPLSEAQKQVLQEKNSIRPTIILHSDGYSDFYSNDVTPESLDRYIVSAKNGHAFAYDWCIGTTAVNYPSKIASTFGGQKNPAVGRQGDKLAIERLNRLLKQCDPIQHLVTKAKEEKIRFSITIRANPFYTPLNSSLNAQYFVDRPHCLLRRLDGTTGYPQLSYAHEDTRNFFLEIAKEVAAYQPDAIVLEYLRHPPFFGYDEPLIQEYTKKYGSCSKKDFMSANWQKMCADIMTAHIRNIRQAINDVNPNIALELNCDWNQYYQHGLDLQTLLAEGLIDVLSPGIGEIGNKKYFPLAPFRKMIANSPKKVLLIPRVEGTIYGGDPTVAEEKGLEVIHRKSLSPNMFKALWFQFEQDGADAIRSFNTGGAWLSAALADVPALHQFRLFDMPLLDLRVAATPVIP